MKQIGRKILLGLALILPLFFLTTTANFYAWNKQFLLLYGSIVLLLLWSIDSFTKKKLVFKRTAFDWPVLFFAAAYLLSLFFASPNKIEALASEAGLVLILTLFYFLVTNFTPVKSTSEEPRRNGGSPSEVLYALVASAGILSLLAIYQFIGIGSEIAPWEWMQSRIWTPAGSPLALISFLAPMVLVCFHLARKANEDLSKVLFFLAAALMIVAVILVGSLILPGKENAVLILGLRSSWQIAIDSFKNSPLFGAGPGNYLNAFTRFKPIEINTTDNWNIRFANAGNYYLHLLTTVGFLGLASYLFLFLRILKHFRRVHSATSEVSTAIPLIFLMQLVLPGGLLQLFLLYLLLALTAKKTTLKFNLAHFSWLPFLVLLPAILGLCAAYFSGRAYAAEHVYYRALQALRANQGQETYDLQRRVLQLNPYLDYYHQTYASTNFGLAINIAGREDPETEESELTDQDRNNFQILVQQAIQEAKVAINLNPQKVDNWITLANIYRNLINVAEGAADWALTASREAIRREPTNPLLRIDLGGLFFAFQAYDEAIDAFQMAANLKPDYANAYYNLAVAYRQKNEIQRAVANMEIVLTLVEPGSGDFDQAQKDLEELKKLLPPAEAVEPREPETLQDPEQAVPSPQISPIELPEESGPEVEPEELEETEPTPTP